jgi:hypothetical protein
MYLKCAHPDCSSDFDYGQGRLFRFHQISPQEKQPSHWHGVKHFWLCSRCCEEYTIEYQRGLGVLLLQRLETLSSGQPCYFVLHAEIAPKLARLCEPARHSEQAQPGAPVSRLPENVHSERRTGRARIRQQKRGRRLAPAVVGAVDVLETRNCERSG